MIITIGDFSGKIKSKLLHLILLSLLIFPFSLISESNSIVEISEFSKFEALTPKLHYFFDPTGNLDIFKIIQLQATDNFRSIETEYFFEKASEKPYWFYFDIKNSLEEVVWIRLGRVNIFFFEIYLPDSDGIYRKSLESGIRSEDPEAYLVNSLYTIPLKLKPSEEVKRVYFKAIGEFPISFSFFIGTLEEIINSRKMNNSIFAWMYIGVVFSLVIYNFFISYQLKSYSHLLYVLFLAYSSLTLPFVLNHPLSNHIFFWDYFFVWFNPVFLLISVFSIVFIQEKEFLFLKNLLLFLSLFVGFGIPLGIYGFGLEINESFRITEYAVELLLIVLILYAGLSAYNGNRYSLYFVIGWGILFISIVLYLYSLHGIFESRQDILLVFTVSFEMVIFALLLSQKVHAIQKDNLDLIHSQNRTLDEEMKLRTQELELSNRILRERNQELNEANLELNEKRKELSELNTNKDRLFSILGHDLRSPIGSLSNIMELLEMQELSSEKFIEYSRRLKSSIKNTFEFLETLLHWSHSQMQGIQINPQEVNVQEKIENVLRILDESFLVKNIKVRRYFQKEIFLRVDPDHFDLILRNLISNSIKFSNPGDWIDITLNEVDGSVEISIIDYGVGMDEETLELIVDQKAIQSKKGTEGEKGLGIGLSLVMDFTRLNNASLQVESVQNQGTKFTLKFRALKKQNSLNL